MVQVPVSETKTRQDDMEDGTNACNSHSLCAVIGFRTAVGNVLNHELLWDIDLAKRRRHVYLGENSRMRSLEEAFIDFRIFERIIAALASDQL